VTHLSAPQLTLELDDARTSTATVWDALPAETRTLVVLALAELVARMLQDGRDE
jgi:hypothetical protein